MNIKHIKVSTRLGLGFGAVLLMLALAIGLSIYDLGKLNDGTSAIVTETYPKVLLAQSIMNDNNKVARSLRNALLIKDAAKSAKELSTVAGKRQEIDATMKKLDATIRSEKGKELFATLQASRAPYEQALEEVIRLRKENDIDGAVDYMLTVMRERQLTNMNAIDALIAHQSNSMETARQQAEATYLDSRNQHLLLGLLSIGLGTAGALLISRQLMRELGGEPGAVAAIAGKIAAGDLSVVIHTRTGDRTSLLFAIQAMRDSLADIVGQVRGGADSIVTAATEIAAGNMDLSSRTEQQAGSLEETASSMEELTATVKQNSENARQANTLARSASEIAVKGGLVVSDVVQTMDEINASARKIVDIISVIDGIAFQTNILALNAAVEAARAGEQGRGFAVVASEVRTLAQRSASAAKEIKLLIDESVSKVGAGTELVGQAGATMGQIVDAVKSVTDIMGEISTASNEQEAGIEQINHAIAEMDTVTQQNAALVEQAAAAAEAQQDQAHQLVQLVGVFKLASDRGAAPVGVGSKRTQTRLALAAPRGSRLAAA
ncbi:methyl-accepting chemotaxis protein [Duganella aceris]|uniref:Methyl-accepting chemotaxis protein n=1 Tax=Duganella aceris TaxID=2703883 RepID=A0ABX0FU89_9BURK|nr:methyl-accepting chemotaxis protein [Duganella aceris]NGZ88263.1 methyl-accepting chemotaxis protein [Duganella aceris]